jgi:hypothetical protein
MFLVFNADDQLVNHSVMLSLKRKIVFREANGEDENKVASPPAGEIRRLSLKRVGRVGLGRIAFP